MGSAPTQEKAPPDLYFENEVWAKVGERTCLNCHVTGGDAEESKFILREDDLDANRAAFQRMASTKKLLVKPTGGLDHGGGAQIKPGSTAYKILDQWVNGTKTAPPPHRPFFDGIVMASPERLVRRLTLSLGGRLPTSEERTEPIDAVLDRVMTEDGFYTRLLEGFNDIFLTLGYAGSATDALSYDHFEKTRHWNQKHDLSHVPEKERTKAGYKLTDDYNKALLREPLELIKHIVRNDKPFTEIVTADYIMVSPYSSRGYGIFETVRGQFKNVDDPFEYIPARIPALKARSGKVQPTADGVYPHSGFLTMFQYLRRYPTTVTNRNRLRARMYYKHFLGIDVMKLAPRVTDAAAVSAKFTNPTLQAPDCVVCHKTVDPVAGLFQDYFNEEGHYGPRKEGWFTDMFGAGLEGKDLPQPERWRSLQWLGAETARDPRFAVAMTEHVYYVLFGRKVLEPPQDIDDPLFGPKRRAYQEQRREIKAIAEKFRKANFNLKAAFKAWAASPFYRVDGVSEIVKDPARRAELDDIGIVRLLTPEQLERKIFAVFGQRWGRLSDSDSKFSILYGGIDSKEVTERNLEPSGAMGAIQRIMANDVACKNVAKDFAREPSQRRLFPSIEPNELSEGKVLPAIEHLHGLILGRVDPAGVKRTYKLFTAIVEDAKGQKVQKQESYFCKSQENKATPDPEYTIRAWRAVVTYLLRQDDFLYE